MSESAIHIRGVIRVLIAEDDELARGALAELIQSEDGLELVAVAGDADEAVEMARQHQPHVALLDVRMPSGGGPTAARGIRLCSPQTRIVALSMHEDRATVLEMIRAGVVGYLVKGEPATLIMDAIRSSAKGRGAISDRVAGEVVGQLAGKLRRDEQQTRHRRARIERIQQVIAGEGLSMALQPIVDLLGGRVLGVEALARFPGRRKKRAPLAWLAEAESVGLRVDLEVATLRAALARIEDLPEGTFLSTNLSPSTAIAPAAREILEGGPAHRMVIEITEHAPVDDYDALNEALRAYRARGGRVAIDDAGAGFASLRHVVRLGPEFIKLDIALTREVDTDPLQRALTTALVTFAREIDAEIIAEGIESQAQLDTLLRLGIMLGQGYHLGPPGRTGVARLVPAGRMAPV